MKAFALGLLLVAASPAGFAAQSVGSPRLDFILHCAGCHGVDGSGDSKGGIPSLRGSIGHYLKVPGGREYLAQVPGASQTPLSDAETAAVMNWMLNAFSAQEMPPDAKPYTADEIRRLRRQPLADVPGQRAELLQRLLREHGIDMKSYR